MDIENLAGKKLGQYELHHWLGSGGMGAVYQGYQPGLERQVAIKVLSNRLETEPDYIDRFTREARTAAALEHAHIVPIYDYGTEQGINYLVMRLLTGGSLTARIKQGADHTLPSLAETAELLEQLAGALDYAHSQGVIHRDIKPSNVMFDDHDSAFLVDFGIVKLIDNTTDISKTSSLIGTPSFIAPELWRDDAITPAADQYSMGVLIYAAVTGRLPFEATTPYGLMHKHLHEKPTPPETWRPTLPPSIKPVLDIALAKNPDRRYPTLTAFALAFRQAVQEQEDQSTSMIAVPSPQQPVPDVFPPDEAPSNSGLLQPTGQRVHDTTRLRNEKRRPFLRRIFAVGLIIALLLVALALIISNNTGGDGTEGTSQNMADGLIVAAVAQTQTPPMTRTQSSSPPPSQTENQPGQTAVAVISTVSSPTFTATSTSTPSLTPTATWTQTPTPTHTLTRTPTLTPAATDTQTATRTRTPTVTRTATPTPTPTVDPPGIKYFSGTLTGNRQSATYTFIWLTDDEVSITLTSNDFDPYLIIRSPEGDVIEDNDDCGGSVILSCVGPVFLPTDGMYTVGVDSFDGSTGAYELEIDVKRDTSCASLTLPFAVITSNADSINLRSGPGTNFDRVRVASRGNCFEIIGRNENSTWLNIRASSERSGWVFALLTEVRGDLDSVPIIN